MATVFLPIKNPPRHIQRLTALRSQILQRLQNVHSLLHLSEDDVVSVEPGARNRRDEELRTVRIGSAVGHRQQTGAVMLQVEVLVGETLAVDGLASHSVSHREIASLEINSVECTYLAHELRDDAVQRAALVMELLSGLANTLLSGAEAAEVLGSLGNDISAELNMIAETERHLKDDTTHVLSVGGEVHVHQRVLRARGKSTENTRGHPSRRRSKLGESEHCS